MNFGGVERILLYADYEINNLRTISAHIIYMSEIYDFCI